MPHSRQYCTFYLDQLLFGVESQKIQEVLRYLELTTVPLAPPAIRGLMNLRGQIVAALDVRRRLHLSERASESVPMCVVVRTPDGVLSLLVDDIGDVVEVEDNTFEAPPDTLSGEVRTVILGVHKLDGKLLHVLDADRVCAVGSSAERKAV